MNKEQVIGTAVKSYFLKLGLECWAEVNTKSGRVADLVCYQRPVYTVIECKQSLTMSLLEQADFWVRSRNAHFVYIAVPTVRDSGRRFAQKICMDYGFGLLEIKIKNCKPESLTVKEKIAPKLWRKAKPKWDLNDEQKSAIPGTFGGGHYTPWKNSIEEIKKYLRIFGPTSIEKVTKNINHHWASNSVAKRCIIKQIQERIIKEIKITDGMMSLL